MYKTSMRIMALDVGDKAIGVAVTDEMGWSAQGLAVIRRKDLKKDIAAITDYIKDYDVGIIVVGMPYAEDDKLGAQAKKVLSFLDIMRDEFAGLFPGLAIETWDESMTTAEAHDVLGRAGMTSGKRKKVVDKLAAVFILESYLRGRDEHAL